ncbi:MAG: glutamine amidotransferase [Planctomycetota bacterium]
MNALVMTNTLAALSVGPIQFDNPGWLWFFPGLVVVIVWLARRSLSGLGTVTRWVALAARLLVVALLVGTLAEPSWRKVAKDVAVTVLLDVSDSVPQARLKQAETYMREAVAASPRKDGDRIGLVTISRIPFVQQLPTTGVTSIDRGFTGKTDATDIAATLKLSLGIAPPDAANRIVIVSDGNETIGSLLVAVAAAQAAGVPVWILPLQYKYDSEVLMERLVAPGMARVGENISLKVVLNATEPTAGLLSIRDDSGPVDLDPETSATGIRVKLEKGPNTFAVPVPVLYRGPIKFEATYEPDVVNGRPVGDTRLENNKQLAVTFVSGEGRILVISEDKAETSALIKALGQGGLPVEEVSTDRAPKDLVEMNAFDAIILANVPRTLFSENQLIDLQRYVREGGGGLVMLGGKDSLGAGIWMDTPVAEALPVDLNPPQKQEMPKGCLGMWVHSVEMPDGRFLGQKTCTAAVDALARLDMAGIAEWGPGGAGWVFPIAELGDKSAIKRAINRLTFGDMSDWTPALQVLLAGMEKANAGQKHCILISDGDPQRPSDALLDKFKNAKPPISITTVAIACHGIQDQSAMEHIAKYTGGRSYIIKPGQENKVPEIFIKEATMVHRPLIREGPAFTPKFTGLSSETFAGIGGLPPIVGYIRTGERGGLAMTTLKNDEGEPLMAQWQYGLGRSIVFASDAGARWATTWPAWGQYAAFWAQHIRWVMRPSNSVVTMRMTPETKGDETLLIVEAMTRDGERLSFVNFQGRLASPDGTQDQDITLREIGPGRYEGRFRTAQSGTYLASLRYRVPMGTGAKAVEGSVAAAINRPFSDEYRTLKDNAALLEQVRDKTGGITLPGDSAKADLWNREGLRFPVSSKPIWLFVAVLSIGLFLVDVAVRRVRIDIPAMYMAARRAMGRGKDKKVEMASLRAAKDKAKESIVQRSGPNMPAETYAATAKFEATSEELKAAKGGPAVERGAGESASKGEEAKLPKTVKQDVEAGMSALLKAKKRAREDIEDR